MSRTSNVDGSGTYVGAHTLWPPLSVGGTIPGYRGDD